LRNISLLPWILRTVLYCGLSGSLFFAVAGLSGTLGLQYNVGYTVHLVDLVVISKFADSLIWLMTLLITSAASFVLTILSDRRLERNLNAAFLLAAVPQISLYLLNEHRIAFFTSVGSCVMFLVASILLHRRLDLGLPRQGFLISSASFLAILVIIESLAIASRTLTVSYGLRITLLLTHARQLQAQLSGLLFVYSPILMLVMLYIWVPMLYLIYRSHFVVGKIGVSSALGPVSLTGRKSSLSMLCVAIAVAIFVTLSPYFTRSTLRGVDAQFYYSWLSSMSSFGEAFGQIAVEPRAPYLILLYAIKLATGWSSLQVVVVGPSFLAVFYTVAAYFLTKELTSSPLAAGLAALLASTWLHTDVGMFAAIYANWLAISFALLFMYFVSKTIRKGANRFVGSLAIFLAYVTAFSHIWTWAILMIANVLGLAFLFLIMRKEKAVDLHVKPYGLILLVSILPMLVLGLAIPGLRQALSGGLYDVVGGMTVARLSSILLLTKLTIQEYVGASFAYAWALVFTILGAILLAKNNPRAAAIVAAWLAVTSVSVGLIDPFYQWRVLYLIPFEVYAAIGVLGLLRGFDWAGRLGEGSSHLVEGVKFLLVVLIVLDSINHALMNVALLPPS